MFRRHFFAALILPSLVLTAVSQSATAAAPKIEFDVPEAIACREVAGDEATADTPNDKLIEVRFQISSLLRSGREADVSHFLYRIEDARRTMQVVDYLPKTQLTSEIIGKVTVDAKQGGSSNIGGSLSARYDGIGAGSLNAGASKSSESHVRYELLPPKELLAASGTILRGYGVYFKLRPSKQTSLEGAKEFVCVLRVPAAWQAGTVTIRCEAFGTAKGGTSVCGRAEFRVALFLPGDEKAKAAAVELVRAKGAYEEVLAAHRIHVKDGAYVGTAKGYRTVEQLSRAVLPDSLVRRYTQLRVPLDAEDLDDRLPEDVHEAVKRLASARWRVKTLNTR
ncbi:MAG: hypothetical protein IID44_02855 [Planctomycetes bacterium]|nr:hypothetical protein [Planctomycetota bacterium]